MPKMAPILEIFLVVIIGIGLFITVTGVLAFYNLFPTPYFLDLIVGFVAGALGILLGFMLDRIAEFRSDIQIKDDYLKLVNEELTDIKNAIYPKGKGVMILYTDIWDSMVSSGLLRLLTSDQVIKLSRLYKRIKGASYEAE